MMLCRRRKMAEERALSERLPEEIFNRIHEDAAKLITELTSAATGLDLTTAEFMRIGRQVHNLEKAFNSHGGFTRRDDYPPRRYWNEPVNSGPYRGEHIDHERWEGMLDEYYALHGWDRETGLQTREALEDLGLRTIADGLEKAGRLAG